MWSAKRRKRVALFWALLVIASLAACNVIEADTGVEGEAPGETGAALDLIRDRFNLDAGDIEGTAQEIVTFSHPTLTVDDAEYQRVVVGTSADPGLMLNLLDLRVVSAGTVGGTSVDESIRIVAETATHYDTGLPRDASPFVAENETGGDDTFALVQIESAAVDDNIDNIDIVLDAVDDAVRESEGFEILIGGEASLEKQLTEIIDEDFGRATFINLPITFIILILAFGAVAAAVVPIILAFAAIILALGLLQVISQGSALAQVYTQVVLLIGLATGIDYALFTITRYRNERSAGLSKEDALRVASGTSGKSIVFAGTTTVFAVAGMFLVNDSIFSSLGLASIVVVLCAVASAMTLLPAMIAMLGDNVDRLTIPFLGRGRSGSEGVWGWLIDRALAYPVIPAVVAIGLLIAIAAPTLSLNLGFNGPRSFPSDADGTKALIALEESFTLGLVQPAVVVIDAGEKQNIFSEETQNATEALVGLVNDDVVSVANPDALYGQIAREPEYNDAGDTGLLFVPVNGDSGEQRAIDAVNNLRDDLVPSAFDDASARAVVTGATAANIDFRENIENRAPIVFAFVLGLAFVILLMTFRSLVIAVTAIVLNLFSVFAAYGLLVLVFQEGWLLEGVLDFEATGIIESWLPLFLFSLLFGLSIDYEMFVMGRIKEEYERGATTQEAIAKGVKGTAGVITNAATIMVAVALIFAFMRELGLKQFGFGLAAAILIDATIIRAFVLPTTMKLLGEWNWYLPSWLNWIPSLSMSEGKSGMMGSEGVQASRSEGAS
jgi:RND superfamily putative drug exporter